MKKIVLLALVVVLAIAVPANAQDGDLSVIAVEQCTDGITLALDTSVSEDEVLVVAWAYVNEIRGVAANQVLLTDLGSGEIEVIIPHAAVVEGDETFYAAILLTERQLGSLPIIIAALTDDNPRNDRAFERFLESVLAVGDATTATDCSIAGLPTTISNVDFDDADFEDFLEDLMEDFQ